MDVSLRQLPDQSFVDIVLATSGIGLDNFIFLFEHIDNGHARLDESPEAFLDTLLVVIRSATGLASVQQSLQHNVFGTIQEYCALRGAHALLEVDRLVHLSWETIDKKAGLLP